MAEYVQLGAVKTWYDEHGEGEPLVVFSDDDLMTLSHAVQMYDALPDAELAVVSGTSYFLTQEKADLVNKIVLDFLTQEPVPTIAAIRRAPRL
ncbi:hypothetical protein [Pseudonocardia sp.]|uniref:alpha/beta fold hydrolase n=1 Tax=Pseudonocardia sp. TaxID=60912 RepID=UPI0031FD1F68